MVPSRPSPRKWSSGSPPIRSERNRTKPLEFPREVCYIVAFVLFLVLKTFNALFSKKKTEDEAPAEPTTKVCPYCQSEIAIKAVRCPHCTSKLEGFPEINE